MNGKFPLLFAILAGLGVFLMWFFPFLQGRPPEPRYDGMRLSVWLYNEERSRVQEGLKVMADHLGEKAVPWLVWALEHGHQPRESGRFEELLHDLTGYSPSTYNEQDQARAALDAAKIEHLTSKREVVAPVLTRLIDDPERGGWAAAKLVEMGQESYGEIIRLSSQGSAIARRNAVASFSHILYHGGQEEQSRAMEALLAALRDTDAEVREVAAYVYRNCKNKLKLGSHGKALPILTGMLSDPSPKAREYSAWALATMGEAAEPAIPQLVTGLSAPEVWVRNRMAFALGQVDRRQKLSEAALAKMAETDPKSECRLEAAKALITLGVKPEKTINRLISELNSAIAYLRMQAMRDLIEIGPPAAEALPLIFQSIESFPSAEYATEVQKLHKFGEDAALPYLIQALSHPDPTVRQGAATYFSTNYPITKAYPGVEAALEAVVINEPNKPAKAAAVRALRKIRQEK